MHVMPGWEPGFIKAVSEGTKAQIFKYKTSIADKLQYACV
jgi:hypothetical protein